jgi:ABC-type proline/glycine betaine transport system permease subunit
MEYRDKQIIDKINKEYSNSHKIIEKINNWYGIIAIIISLFLIFGYPGIKRIFTLFYIILTYLNITISEDNLETVATWITSILFCIVIIVFFTIKIIVNTIVKIIINNKNIK